MCLLENFITSFMAKTEPRSLFYIQEIERLEQCVTPYELFHVPNRRAQLINLIGAALGDDGQDALMGSRAIMKISRPDHTENDLRAVRRQLIDLFEERKISALPKQSSSTYTPPLRQRMKIQAEQRNDGPLPPPLFRDFAKSESIKIGIGAIFFIAWVATAPSLYGSYSTNDFVTPGQLVGALWAVTLSAYFVLAWRMWVTLSRSLNNLIDPEKRSGQTKSAIFTKYIAAAFMVGLTLILALLYFDYVAHSAAAKAGDRKAEAIAELAAKNNSLWHIQLSPQPTVDVASSFNADFGSYAGTFGDFFGGVMNPVLTFGTLLALAITILMQRSQLIDEKNHADESSKVSNLQAFETTFFNLLNLHNATVAELKVEADTFLLPSDTEKKKFAQQWGIKQPPDLNGHPEAAGRATFATALSSMHDLYVKVKKYQPLDKHIKEPQDIYEVIQRDHNNILGHYFRNLYQALAFVDRYSAPLSSGDIEVEHLARKRYTNILRAQLSSHELNTLFYNCLDETVDSGSFRSLLVEYAFLEHLSLEYVYSTHELRFKGYDFAVTHKVAQYFGAREKNKESIGAFGKNPQLAEYLLMQRVFQ